MKSKLVNLAVDFVATFAAAYVAMLASGDTPTAALWSLLAGALAGAVQAMNPKNTRYGVGS